MLRIVECEYPNPEYKYGIFYLGDHEIGRASKAEGGWIPNGKRKALPEEMAAKAMIDSAISKARRDEAHARKMLEALRMYCGGRLPPDGKVTPNAPHEGPGAASSRTVPLDVVVGPLESGKEEA